MVFSMYVEFEFYVSRRLINMGGRGVCMATV